MSIQSPSAVFEQLVKMNSESLTPVVAIIEYGCIVTVENGALFSVPILADGSAARDAAGEYAWHEVTASVSQDFLNKVNQELGTNFRMNQFPGR